MPRFSEAVTIDPVMNVVKHTGEKPTCTTERKPTAGGKASVKHTNAFLAIFVLIVILLFLWNRATNGFVKFLWDNLLTLLAFLWAFYPFTVKWNLDLVSLMLTFASVPNRMLTCDQLNKRYQMRFANFFFALCIRIFGSGKVKSVDCSVFTSFRHENGLWFISELSCPLIDSLL